MCKHRNATLLKFAHSGKPYNLDILKPGTVLTSPKKCSLPFPFFALLHAAIKFLLCISVFSCTALLIRTMSCNC